MRMNNLNPGNKAYLLRVYDQYLAKKLTSNEKTQLMQDLYDSGLYLELEPIVAIQINILLQKKLILQKEDV